MNSCKPPTRKNGIFLQESDPQLSFPIPYIAVHVILGVSQYKINEEDTTQQFAIPAMLCETCLVTYQDSLQYRIHWCSHTPFSEQGWSLHKRAKVQHRSIFLKLILKHSILLIRIRQFLVMRHVPCHQRFKSQPGVPQHFNTVQNSFLYRDLSYYRVLY